jgi:AcrR family transcriptional regulator
MKLVSPALPTALSPALAAATPAAPAAPAEAQAGSARQRRKEARPQELLAAALDLFVEKGFAATRAEEVAQRAGVSKGTLYLYYPSKEELFKAVVRNSLSALITEGAEIAARYEGDSSSLLAVLLQTWWERVGNTPAAGIHKIVLSEVRNFPDLAQFYTDEVINPSHALICGCVRRGIARGEFRDLPAEEVTTALIAPVIFMALHRHSFGCCPVSNGVEIEPGAVLNTHLELALRGLEAPPAARGQKGAPRRTAGAGPAA